MSDVSETKTPQPAQPFPGAQSVPAAQQFQGPQTLEPFLGPQAAQPGHSLQPVPPLSATRTGQVPLQPSHAQPVQPARPVPPQPVPPAQPRPIPQGSRALPMHTLQYRFDGPQDAPVLVIGPSARYHLAQVVATVQGRPADPGRGHSARSEPHSAGESAQSVRPV
ncbi:hypothetical protein ACFRCW_11495 [Streptomyces sp. NPDC056653]|uniref:hypothetical protein n=1 Tax=Streptomyces sp. NPDC056653 TaxID=3345894 RepID=UPI003685E6D2